MARQENLDRLRNLLPDAHLDRHPFTRRDVPGLVMLLQDRVMCNRCDALVALSRLRARKAVPAMVRCLSDRDWVVRCDAAEALGVVGDPRAIPALRRALATRNSHVRGYVIRALADLKDSGSKRRFERMFRGRSKSDHVASTSALYALTGEKIYIEELGRLVRHAPDWRLRYNAFQDLEWVMRPRDRVQVTKWLRSALRAEKDSPGLRKDLRKALARLER